jgi:class 3 adenylate cyclase
MGLHTGEWELLDNKPAGVAVHTDARVPAIADEILVTSAVKDLVAGSGVAFADTGEHKLRGLADQVRMYRVAALSHGAMNRARAHWRRCLTQSDSRW